MFTYDTSHARSRLSHEAALAPLLSAAAARLTQLEKQAADGSLPLLADVLGAGGSTIDIKRDAAAISARFATVFVCGMGGSSLNGEMLAGLTRGAFNAHAGKPRLLALDNIDPHSMEQLQAHTDAASSLFLLVSKSGGTAESLAHAYTLWDFAKATLGDKAAEHFLVITEPQDNALRRFAEKRGIAIRPHPTGIGGRFAAFTNVGLLPAALAGLDIDAVREGAARALRQAFMQKETATAAQGAAIHAALAAEGKNITVLLPYCDRLLAFARWHRQIWAESLGKQGKGLTPAPAIGAVDQHSQLQLYLQGPKDKCFTLLALPHQGAGPVIRCDEDASLSYLSGRRLGDLMQAEQDATRQTLLECGAPVITLTLPALNEQTLGALAMHYMLETILTAHLLSIDPFDQPAVEQGKILAREALGNM